MRAPDFRSRCGQMHGRSTRDNDQRKLGFVSDVAEENGARAVTDHLGFTHARPAGPSIGTRSRGSASAGSGTATFSPGTRMVAFVITAQSPHLNLL